MRLKMNIQIINKNKIAISRTATVIIFLALIRCISEPFRLQCYSTTVLTFTELKPFLIGALITAIALLLITIFSFFARDKFIIAVSILTIILLLVEKRITRNQRSVTSINQSGSITSQIAHIIRPELKLADKTHEAWEKLQTKLFHRPVFEPGEVVCIILVGNLAQAALANITLSISYFDMDGRAYQQQYSKFGFYENLAKPEFFDKI
jgi:hypothetical protein